MAEYIYNAVGLRTRKIVHEGETQRVTVFHYGLGGELQTETDGGGRVLRDYVWANGVLVAQVKDLLRKAGSLVEELRANWLLVEKDVLLRGHAGKSFHVCIAD